VTIGGGCTELCIVVRDKTLYQGCGNFGSAARGLVICTYKSVRTYERRS
jgi:hypothetical protein